MLKLYIQLVHPLTDVLSSLSTIVSYNSPNEVGSFVVRNVYKGVITGCYWDSLFLFNENFHVLT